MKTEFISLYAVRQSLTKIDGRRWSFRIALSMPEAYANQALLGSRSWAAYVSDLSS